MIIAAVFFTVFFCGFKYLKGDTPSRRKSSETLQEISNWKEGQPIPKELLSYRRTPGCFLIDTDTQALYQKTNNYPLLFTLIINPIADDIAFDYAVEKALLLIGPSRLFSDLNKLYLINPGLLNLSRHINLKARMKYRHVLIDTLVIDEETMPLNEAKDIFKQTQQELQNGIPWDEVNKKYADRYRYVKKTGINKGLNLTIIGNYGDFVVSVHKFDAKPFRDIQIPANHLLPLLSSKKGDVITLYSASKKRLFQYSVREAFQGLDRGSIPNFVERCIMIIQSIINSFDSSGADDFSSY